MGKIYRKKGGFAVIHTCENCKVKFKRNRKISRFCGHDCYSKNLIGKSLSDSTKEKQSKAKAGYMPVNTFRRGKDQPFWNPNRAEVNRRWWPEYREWRLAVLKRDNYQCKCCGIRSVKGKRIVFDVDHIKSWSKHPESRFDVSNGRVLCRPCHKKTDSYLNRWAQ